MTTPQRVFCTCLEKLVKTFLNFACILSVVSTKQLVNKTEQNRILKHNKRAWDNIIALHTFIEHFIKPFRYFMNEFFYNSVSKIAHFQKKMNKAPAL